MDTGRVFLVPVYELRLWRTHRTWTHSLDPREAYTPTAFDDLYWILYVPGDEACVVWAPGQVTHPRASDIVYSRGPPEETVDEGLAGATTGWIGVSPCQLGMLRPLGMR